MNVRVAKDLIRVLLIGGGQGGLSILKELSLLDNVQVLGLADLNPQAPGAAEAKRRGIPVWGDFHPMLRLKDYDVVVEATGVPDIHLEIEREKRPDSVLIVAEAALLMMRLIERHEEEAAANCRFQPDADSVLNRFASAGIRLAVITRNTRHSADIVLGRLGVRFDPILTREFPFLKPSPEPVRHILTCWQLNPRNVMMIGDYIHDIISGREAGTHTCYYRGPSLHDAWSSEADFTVSSYAELAGLIL